ncbi:MAG: hypothetical protein N3G20_06395, partial [Verrucomicrobiae bacterium]|nr:hypothetical protein [Verrucomicrobiae bacterium]
MVANFWSGVFLRAVVAAGFAGGFGCAILGADLLPRALPQGQLPNDVRLGPLKDLDGYFPFTPCRSVDEWNRRAERVRRQMLVALGLWPFPTRTPLNAVIHGKIERDDYSVEKVYFESLPGFYVTGNLYRPKGSPNGKRKPGILSPHGHWRDGRFHDAGIEVVRREIVEGAERFEEGGRSPLQARCVQLARMGCVVFHYDMIGYADSVQIPQSLAHGFSKQRPEMNTEENWGLFSPAAEAHCQSVMGLQTWNSIRALDFLLSLPDVDPERIGVTGASGGGTQTFILCAVDPRPTLAFPAVMVSTAMQGGCTCENACLLRIGTGNVEFAALFAPKPLGLTSANDWTREMSTKGFPELKQHYAMLGHPENVMLKRGEHFGHNYNYVSRAAMYAWVNRHFKLGLPEPIIESDYRRLTREEMSVWNGEHHKPEGGPEFERRLLKYLTEDAKKLLQQATSDPQTFRRIWGGGIDIVFGRNFGDVGDVRAISKTSRNLEGVPCEILLLRNETHGEELPVICLKPGSDPRSFVVWADVNGKAGLFDGSPASEPRLRTEIKEILDAGVGVVGVDLLFQGEFLADGKQLTKARKVNNPREAAAYTFGYNHALFAQRVHDLLTVVKHLKTQGVETVGLAGFEGAGPWVAGAVAQGMGAVTCAALDTQGFRFGKVLDIYHVDFLPGGAKYGDLAGMLALAPPTRLWVTGETENSLSIARQQFAAAGLPGGLVCWQGAQ